MRKRALYFLIGLFLIFLFLTTSGLVSIRVSSVWHYKFNDTEAKLLDDFVLKFREQIESGNFDEIQSELAEGIGSKSEVIENMKKSRRKFGKPVFWRLRNSSPPADAVKYYTKLSGSQYYTYFWTNTDDGDLITEQFNWIITSSGEVKVIDYSAMPAQEWEIRAQEDPRRLEKYQHEIVIPFGERDIEIRY